MNRTQDASAVMAIDTDWKRSSFCANGACVEVQMLEAGAGVLVRDSKQDQGPVLSFDAEEWRAFTAGVRQAEFEV